MLRPGRRWVQSFVAAIRVIESNAARFARAGRPRTFPFRGLVRRAPSLATFAGSIPFLPRPESTSFISKPPDRSVAVYRRKISTPENSGFPRFETKMGPAGPTIRTPRLSLTFARTRALDPTPSDGPSAPPATLPTRITRTRTAVADRTRAGVTANATPYPTGSVATPKIEPTHPSTRASVALDPRRREPRLTRVRQPAADRHPDQQRRHRRPRE